MRSKILDLLTGDDWQPTSAISNHVSITASTVLYHLRNMMREGIVQRDSSGRGWKIVPTQQAELTEFLSKKRKK